MTQEVRVPAVGESVTEGVLARWLVADGAWVDIDAPIYELETDKISTEVPAPAAGVLTHRAAEGDTVAIDQVVAELDTEATSPAPSAPDHIEPTTEPGPSAEPAAKTLPERAPSKPRIEDQGPTLSPAVKQLVADHRLDPSTISGTGPGGRITKGDVQQHLAKAERSQSQPVAQQNSQQTAPRTPEVRAANSDETRKRMSPLRQKIAQRLVSAQRTAAMLTTFNEVDMSAAMALRTKYKEAFTEKHGVGLGFMGFFVTAAVAALQRYPGINSRIEGDEVVTPAGQHIGIAVGTDKGLVVPVVRDAQNMGFADIEHSIRGYAKKAREGKMTIADMDGGTFTITNGGVYGSLMSTPILNPPQSGILGMHAIKDRAVAVDGQVVVRPMMYIALSYDHRIVDGAEAVGFLVTIKDLVEAPERLLFDL